MVGVYVRGRNWDCLETMTMEAIYTYTVEW